jgi:hypothetical protein
MRFVPQRSSTCPCGGVRRFLVKTPHRFTSMPTGVFSWRNTLLQVVRLKDGVRGTVADRRIQSHDRRIRSQDVMHATVFVPLETLDFTSQVRRPKSSIKSGVKLHQMKTLPQIPRGGDGYQYLQLRDREPLRRPRKLYWQSSNWKRDYKHYGGGQPSRRCAGLIGLRDNLAAAPVGLNVIPNIS